MHSQMNSDYIDRAGINVAMFVANGVMNDSRVLKTAQTVQKSGFNTTVYGIGKYKTTQSVKFYSFNIILLPNPRTKLKEDGLLSEYNKNKRMDLLVKVFVNHLYNELKKNPPDILHTHDMNGIAVGGKVLELLSSKNISWIHDVHEYVRGLTDIHETSRNFYIDMESRYIKSPDILSSVSPVLNRYLMETYKLKREPELILNSPRFSDYNIHYQPTIRNVLGLKAEVPIIVYSGGVKPIRSVDTIVEALPCIPGVHLSIITNNVGEYVESIKKRARELEIENRVHFLPYVPFFNVTSFLSSANVGIHPIKRYPNAELALPNKLFEYIHAGLPVIVSSNPSMSEFVERNDCGSVFSVNDHESLARQIKQVLDRQKKDNTWKNSILSLSQKYSWEVQEETLAKMYTELPLVKGKSNSETEEQFENQFKILHLPVAGAGQPAIFTKQLKKNGNNVDSLEIGKNSYCYDSDFFIDEVHSLNDFSNFYDKQLKPYDIFHFHARSLLCKPHYPYPSGLDLLILRAAGKKVFFHFRGSELRMASIFKQACPYNYVDENPNNIFVNYLESEQTFFSEYVHSVCHGVFVTDPELKSYLPQAIIMPRVIDLEKWPFIGVKKTKTIKIVHAPSRKIVKGTKAIVSAVEKLQSQGVQIEFRLIENMTNEEARSNYIWADVIIDQVRIGWYGVLAVEAMALGKAVVSYVRDDLKHHLPFPFPLEIANMSNIYEVLKDLLNNPDRIERIGIRGRKYVEDYHSVQHVTPILMQAYQTLENPLEPRLISNMHIYQESKIRGIYKKKFKHKYSVINNTFYDKLKIKLEQFITLSQTEGFTFAVKKASKKIAGLS